MLNPEQSGYNLSFAGCGFLGLYHAGVCGCIQEFAPQLYENQNISGASAGAIAATFLMCNIKISDCIQYLMQAINNARSYILGPFDPRFKITQLLREGLEIYLPENAHILCSGRLHISMTNQTTKQNYIAKTFKDRNELIKAVLCSSYIPFFSGFIPLTFRGEWMIDGALTRNMLKLDGKTITVSPFSGDADICPRDDWGFGQLSIAGTSFLVNSENIQRLINIIWPKSPEELGKLTQLGYSDALQFLARKGFIKCQLHRYVTVFMKMRVNSQYHIIDESCKKCRKYLHLALKSSLSKSILVAFIDPEKKAFYNNFLTRKLLKYLKMLLHVSTMPISLTVKIIHRCVTIIKYLPSHLVKSLMNVICTLSKLDEIFKKALSNEIEINCHYDLCNALEKLSIDSEDSLTEFENEIFTSSESEIENDQLDLGNEVLCSKIYLPGIDLEKTEKIFTKIEEFDNVTADMFVETCETNEMNQTDKRPEVLGAENRELSELSLRGEADGSESELFTNKSEQDVNEMHLNFDHKISWCYPDLSNPGQISYFVLAPVMESNCSNSSENASELS